MYWWISDRASNALFSLYSLSGSDRVASNKESRKLTSSEMVFLDSFESPTSANYQAYKIITVNSKLITFQLTNKTNNHPFLSFQLFFLLLSTIMPFMNWLIWAYLPIQALILLIETTYGMLINYFELISISSPG